MKTNVLLVVAGICMSALLLSSCDTPVGQGAAPHAAPCPTGVSQELRRRALIQIPATTRRTFVFIESHPSNHEQRVDIAVARHFSPPTERCVLGWVATYGLPNTLLTFVSRTSAPCAIFEQSYLSCGGYGLMTTP